jgi:hypothetical protein
MKKISSGTTTFYKKIFPLIWFGFLAFFVATSVTTGALREGQWMFLAVPCFMAVFGYFLMKSSCGISLTRSTTAAIPC